MAAVALLALSLPSYAQLTELTATEAAARIRAGKLTSVELVEALLEQARAGKHLNAFITLDEQGALAAARWADASARADKFSGALHGVPIVIKDNIHVAGLPNTAGTPALKAYVPTTSAPVAQRLIDAGAIVLGKTNMHELAFGITSNNSAFGAAANPYDPSRFAGGSSGGTGTAIAARMAPAGLGSDTGGSVRIPAAVNGIAGLRPTLGRYSQEAITPISHTRDTAGPMAASVADLVLLDGVITGTPTAIDAAALRGLRIGVPRGYFYDTLEAETARLMSEALDKMRRAGVVLVEADIPNVADLNNKVSFPVALFEVMQDLPAYLEKHHIGVAFAQLVEQLASPDVKGLFGALTTGQPPSIPEKVYNEALAARPALKKAYADYFKANGVAAIVFPTTPAPSQSIAEGSAEFQLLGKKVPTFPTFIRNTDPGSNAGIPGLSIPVGLTKDGLPVGMELDGPEGSDRQLLAIGLALEKLFPRLAGPKP